MIDKNKYVSMRLKKIKSAHYIIEATISDKRGTFLIDTGASNSCIDELKQKGFNLKVKEENVKVTVASPGILNAILTKNCFIKFKSNYKKRMFFLLIDMSPINTSLKENEIQEIDGILGADFLSKTKAIIDYGKNKIYLKL